VPHDEAEAIQRDSRVHLLGNLSLVSGRLNPTLSNRPWTTAEAEARGLPAQGKRDYLLEHSNLNLNARLVARHPSSWTDQDIGDRTEQLIDRLLALWPRPDAAAPAEPVVVDLGDVSDSVDDDADEDRAATPAHAGKYRDLWRWLNQQEPDEIAVSFTQVEEILGMPLPPSARNHEAHWYGYDGTALGRAIRDAGWRATAVNLLEESVRFARVLSTSTEGSPGS